MGSLSGDGICMVASMPGSREGDVPPCAPPHPHPCPPWPPFPPRGSLWSHNATPGIPDPRSQIPDISHSSLLMAHPILGHCLWSPAASSPSKLPVPVPNMSVSLRGCRPREQEPEKSFWLEFQVCSDGHHDHQQPRHAAAAAAAPATFTCFGDLPVELRLKIWEHLLQPRVVIAACLDEDNAADKRAQLARRPCLPAAPVLLRVCHEARAVALRRYERAFAWRVPAMLARPRSAPARVWFDFSRDTLLLLGELEPYDSSNINAPMVYFLDRADARRVRHVACAFEELRFGEVESEQIFGCLFHVLDSFTGAGRLLITSTDDDLRRHTMIGCLPSSTDNVVQKIWWAWINGTSIVTSRMKDRQILMVREDGLADFVAEHI